MSSPILITVPKYVSGTNPVFKDYVECKTSEQLKGRKRRLDHLSWEEKLQRKKLKNRVAAQTSRDRKKLKMEEMEVTIKDLMDQNQLLLEECQQLRDLNKKLTTENQSLRSSTSCQCLAQSSSVDSNASIGSAVSRAPLPQGEAIESAVALSRRQATVMVLKMVLVCLLTQSSSESLTLKGLRSSLRAYSRISPQTWKLLLRKDRLHQIVSKKISQKKWWGRHQNNWNPVESQA